MVDLEEIVVGSAGFLRFIEGYHDIVPVESESVFR
jgi:hypothetical protein